MKKDTVLPYLRPRTHSWESPESVARALKNLLLRSIPNTLADSITEGIIALDFPPLVPMSADECRHLAEIFSEDRLLAPFFEFPKKAWEAASDLLTMGVDFEDPLASTRYALDIRELEDDVGIPDLTHETLIYTPPLLKSVNDLLVFKNSYKPLFAALRPRPGCESRERPATDIKFKKLSTTRLDLRIFVGTITDLLRIVKERDIKFVSGRIRGAIKNVMQMEDRFYKEARPDKFPAFNATTKQLLLRLLEYPNELTDAEAIEFEELYVEVRAHLTQLLDVLGPAAPFLDWAVSFGNDAWDGARGILSAAVDRYAKAQLMKDLTSDAPSDNSLYTIFILSETLHFLRDSIAEIESHASDELRPFAYCCLSDTFKFDSRFVLNALVTNTHFGNIAFAYALARCDTRTREAFHLLKSVSTDPTFDVSRLSEESVHSIVNLVRRAEGSYTVSYPSDVIDILSWRLARSPSLLGCLPDLDRTKYDSAAYADSEAPADYSIEDRYGYEHWVPDIGIDLDSYEEYWSYTESQNRD